MSNGELKKRLKSEYLEHGTYESVADKYEVSRALLWKIINTDYEPKRFDIREKFGLPEESAVVSVNGRVPGGSITLGAHQCECGQYFISNHPRRQKCFICSPYRGKPK